MSFLINPFMVTSGALPAPEFHSNQQFATSSAVNIWNISLGDCSDCDMIVITVMMTVTGRRLEVEGSSISAGWIRLTPVASLNGGLNSAGSILTAYKANPSASESFDIRNLPNQGSPDGNTQQMIAVMTKVLNADTAIYDRTNGANATVTTSDPPSINFGSITPALVIAGAGFTGSGVPTEPSGYTNALYAQRAVAPLMTLATASKQVNASSEDPGTFSTTVAGRQSSITVGCYKL